LIAAHRLDDATAAIRRYSFRASRIFMSQQVETCLHYVIAAMPGHGVRTTRRHRGIPSPGSDGNRGLYGADTVFPNSDSLRLALGVGLLGAYTTFSTFEFETHALLEDGLGWGATLNVAASVLWAYWQCAWGSSRTRRCSREV
jgi:hypothetical protein